MGSLNKVILVGNLGRDADLRFTTSGSAVSNFGMATTETWLDKSGQKQERTEWHNVVYWGKGAEAVNQYLVKGKQVLVEGSLQTREWEKDGIKRKTTEIRAQRVTLLGGGGGGQRAGRPRTQNQQVEPEYGIEPEQELRGDFGTEEPQPLTDDDIPF